MAKDKRNERFRNKFVDSGEGFWGIDEEMIDKYRGGYPTPKNLSDEEWKELKKKKKRK